MFLYHWPLQASMLREQETQNLCTCFVYTQHPALRQPSDRCLDLFPEDLTIVTPLEVFLGNGIAVSLHTVPSGWVMGTATSLDFVLFFPSLSYGWQWNKATPKLVSDGEGEV